MKADIITLCHSALAEGNKFSILGAFNIIYVPSLPYRMPSSVLALRLIFDSTEDGAYQFTISLVGTDGQTLHQLVRRISVPPLPAHISESLHPSTPLSIVCQLPEIELKTHGKQAIDLHLFGGLDMDQRLRAAFFVYPASAVSSL